MQALHHSILSTVAQSRARKQLGHVPSSTRGWAEKDAGLVYDCKLAFALRAALHLTRDMSNRKKATKELQIGKVRHHQQEDSFLQVMPRAQLALHIQTVTVDLLGVCESSRHRGILPVGSDSVHHSLTCS
eukprot:4922997-Amphidinium_carterae.1